MAMVFGLGFEKALGSITLDAAKILKIDEQYGTLEPGKAADLVLYDGHPFEYTTHVTQVIAGGRLAYDRGSRSTVPLAARSSGYGSEPACCLSFSSTEAVANPKWSGASWPGPGGGDTRDKLLDSGRMRPARHIA